jgi:hypothetical protein
MVKNPLLSARSVEALSLRRFNADTLSSVRPVAPTAPRRLRRPHQPRRLYRLRRLRRAIAY